MPMHTSGMHRQLARSVTPYSFASPPRGGFAQGAAGRPQVRLMSRMPRRYGIVTVYLCNYVIPHLLLFYMLFP